MPSRATRHGGGAGSRGRGRPPGAHVVPVAGVRAVKCPFSARRKQTALGGLWVAQLPCAGVGENEKRNLMQFYNGRSSLIAPGRALGIAVRARVLAVEK